MSVSKKTAMDIALAYREVEAAEELLAKVTADLSRYGPSGPDIRDAFGRPQTGLQLGVPSGQGGHTIYNVPWTVVRPILELHIATQKAVIATMSEKAAAEVAEARP